MIRELEKKTPAGQAGFDVVITGAGERKIQLIKEVREATGLGLAEAKEFVETPPKAVREGLSRGEAEALKAKLEAAGAAVELRRGKGGGGGEEREGETGGGESIEAE
ncbi:MAG: ribosomal protein L7/L12 [Planctomycetes bacterium]|nr:ribosomal protein L7/L12 [Planctomycetota bacterium]